MTTAIVVDQNCDLSDETITKLGIKVLPANFVVNGTQSLIPRQESHLFNVYVSGQINKSNDLALENANESTLKTFFDSEVLGKYKDAIVQTAGRSHSSGYGSLNSSLSRLDNSQTRVRLVSSKVVASGQAVMAVYAAKLIAQGITGATLRQRLDLISDRLYCYAISPDLDYIHALGKKRGEKTVNGFMAKLGKMAKIAPIIRFHNDKAEGVDHKTRGFIPALEKTVANITTQIENGLITPVICMSYAGNLSDLEQYDAIHQLRHICELHKVELHIAHMGLGTGINLGAKSICFGFAAKEHDFVE